MGINKYKHKLYEFKEIILFGFRATHSARPANWNWR